MNIRPADIDDAHAIATIHVRSWQHTYADILPAEGLAHLSIDQRSTQWAGWLQAESSPMRTFVAEVDDKVVGFTSWGPDSDSDDAMLYSIYLLPESKGLGIGSALLRAAESSMVESGAAAASLHVLKENTATRAFYAKHNWQLVPQSEQVEHFFGMEMTTVRYLKQLS